MTHRDRILAFLAERPSLWFDDDELARALQIRPRQAVNQICRKLHAAGQIRREQRDGKLRNSAAGAGLPAGAVAASLQSREEGPSMTPAGFEALAARVLSQHFGVSLAPGSVRNVPKRFDLVSPGGEVVGDAKFYTLVRGENLPPAKFSVIAEHLWLLEKTGARTKFLVFGNDRRVPEQWLRRYGHLAGDVAFFFLTPAGELERLT
ncbi:MAG: hypothetical protein ACOY93_04045 [Bacillota bacterium]